MHVVRSVSRQGTISTVAGDSGQSRVDRRRRPRRRRRCWTRQPTSSTLPDGGFLIADHDKDRVRHVRADGLIVNFAGTEQNGYAGDGGPATAADLHGPHALSLTHGGDILIADGDNHRIRSVDSDFAPPTNNPPGPVDDPPGLRARAHATFRDPFRAGVGRAGAGRVGGVARGFGR